MTRPGPHNLEACRVLLKVLYEIRGNNTSEKSKKMLFLKKRTPMVRIVDRREVFSILKPL